MAGLTFVIRLGVPEMKDYWDDLCAQNARGALSGNEARDYRKIGKAMKLISINPRHPGLRTHEISDLTRKYGFKVFESYLENKTPAAGRVFWAYAPGRGNITILGIEPHPEDAKSGAYQRVKLSAVPKG